VRKPLREQPGLHLSRDLQIVRGAALGLQFFRCRTALRLDRAAHHVEAHEVEGVSVDVPEACECAAPDWIGLVERLLRA
jgi:hypothetical protein